MSPEERLPREILRKAIRTGKEFGWREIDFMETVEAARALRRATIGGQVQFALPDATCELSWLNYDSSPRERSESWIEYCNRTAAQAIHLFQIIITSTDIENDAVLHFPVLMRHRLAGTRLEDYKVFILYFNDTETDSSALD